MQVIQKLEKMDSRHCFYIAMALSKGVIDVTKLKTDLFYMLFLRVSGFIAEYNLFDIG